MKRKLALLTLSVVSAFSMSACSSSTGGDTVASTTPAASAAASAKPVVSNDGPFTKYEQPITISIGRIGVSGNNLPAGDTLENNQYLKYIQDKLNVQIKYDFTVADGDAYNQKVNLALSSGQIPDVMIVNEDQFKRLAQADLLADLTGLYDKYMSPFLQENYKSYGDRLLNTAKVNNKLMALPNSNIDGNYPLVWLRKDWLDKLKLQVPSTMDEMIAVAKAFKEQNPNGKNDNLGILGDSKIYGTGFFAFDSIFNFYHSYPGSWIKDSSGNIVYGSTTPETKQALSTLRDMYAKGLIDKEFLTRKSYDDNAGFVASGRSGIVFAPWYAGWMLSESVKTDPNSEWIPVQGPLDSAGKRNVALQKPSDTFLVVKKGIKNPEAVLKVLNVQYQGLRLLDPAAAEIYKDKGVSWLNWPFPLAVDYYDTVARGANAYKTALDTKDTSKLTLAQKATFDSVQKDMASPKKDLPSYANSLAFYGGGMAVGSDKVKRIETVFDGTTDTMLKKGANMTKLESETFLKIVTGTAPIDEFDKFVTQWKSIGGDEVTKEVIAAAKK